MDASGAGPVVGQNPSVCRRGPDVATSKPATDLPEQPAHLGDGHAHEEHADQEVELELLGVERPRGVGREAVGVHAGDPLGTTDDRADHREGEDRPTESHRPSDGPDDPPTAVTAGGVHGEHEFVERSHVRFSGVWVLLLADCNILLLNIFFVNLSSCQIPENSVK